MLVARGEDALARITDEIASAGGKASYAVADVGSLNEVRAAARKTIDLWGRIDTWVNCAGVAIYARLVDTPLDEHERMFRTNYFGVVNGAITAIEHLRAAGGSIITVGSIAGDIPSPVLSAYSASKHAVKGFIGSLRMEIQMDRLPISVTLVKPSGIDTPIAQHAGNHVAGEARVPPLVYHPILVAEAILDAAEHERREVTVGGAGRAQVLFGAHFPVLLEKLSKLLIPQLVDSTRAKTPGDSLFAPANEGRERSGIERPKRFSLYNIALHHPAAGVAFAAGLATLFMLRRRLSLHAKKRRYPV